MFIALLHFAVPRHLKLKTKEVACAVILKILGYIMKQVVLAVLPDVLANQYGRPWTEVTKQAVFLPTTKRGVCVRELCYEPRREK